MTSRIQLRRTKGWRMPPNTVKVARPGPWGNPWRVVDERKLGNGWVVLDPDWMMPPRRHFCSSKAVAVHLAVWFHRRWCTTIFAPPAATLRGKNLAYFCPLDGPCHGDTLLELANA